jgi:hypothetical protein
VEPVLSLLTYSQVLLIILAPGIGLLLLMAFEHGHKRRHKPPE